MTRPQPNIIKLVRWKKLPRYGYRYPAATHVAFHSAISIKNTLEQYAYYFRREFHYDFVQYDAETHTHDREVKAYIFPDPQGKFYWVGGCCFRYRQKEDKNYWALQWIWVHPQYRGQGVAKAAWSTFEEEIGPFRIEAPVSISMQYFLLKIGFPEKDVEGGYKIVLK